MLTFSGSLLLTFRELWALRITQAMFGVATLVWLVLSLAMNLDIVEGSLAALRIFGLESTPMDAYRDAATGDIVRRNLTASSFVMAVNELIFGATYFLGTLLGLFATAPLVSGMLEAGRIDLLLSKPVSRHRLLGGHVVGLLTAVAILATYLIGSVWLTLSVKTGIWEPGLLLSIPVMVLMFGVMYSVLLVSTLTTRSAGLGLAVAYGLIFISVIMMAHEQIVPLLDGAGLYAFLILYHISPNFAEVGRMVSQLASPAGVLDTYPFVSSLLFGALLHAISFQYFSRRDF